MGAGQSTVEIGAPSLPVAGSRGSTLMVLDP